MPTSVFASLLIAFVAAAGAVPLLRDLLRGKASVRSAGGAAVSLGVLVAAFYSDPWPASDHGLVFGAAALIGVGLWLDHRNALATARGRRLFDVAGTVVAAIFLFAYLDPGYVTWSVGFIMLVAACLLLPIATSALDRLPTANPALPAAMVLVQLLLLIAFGAAHADGGGRYSLYAEFAIVALPVMGALLGCLVYLLSMPWRPQAGIAMGAGGLLALGFVVAWGILRLGSITAEVRGGTTALLWLVAVPLFEFVREVLARLADALSRTALLNRARGLRRVLQAIRAAQYSPLALVLAQALLGAVGLGLCVLDTSGYLLTLALLGVAGVYMVLPVLVSAASQASNNRLIQGLFPRHGSDRA
ncbi:MAG: hypothetical protein Q4E06_02665 [Lautropia sp.]|nr:hypothetical protein [Lautropia sp.]